MSRPLAVSHQSKTATIAPSDIASRLVTVAALLQVSVTSNNYITDLNQIVKSACVFVSQPDYVGLLEHCVGACINTCVCGVVLLKPNLGFVIDSEITELCLSANGELSPDVGHLKGFLSKFPFVPVVVRLNIFLYKVRRAVITLVDHQRR